MSEQNENLVHEIKKKLEDVKSGKVVKETARNPDLKNPDEVKEYLDGLFVEYSYQCVNEKLPEGCHRLANYLENIRAEYRQATELYKKNCDEYQFPRSCATYAKNKTLGRGNLH